jgi:hypothetical protein
MAEDRIAGRGPEMGRWLIVGALLLVGLGLFLVYGRSSEPPARPTEHEER